MEIGGFSIFYLVYMVIAIGLSIQLLLDNKTPQSTFAWILALFLIPYGGAIIYIMGGLNWRRRRLVRLRPEDLFAETMQRIIDEQRTQIEDQYSNLGSDISKILTLTLRSGNAIVAQVKRLEFFFEGRILFERLMEDLRGAEHSIHIEYFIFRYDEVGKEIVSILKQKVAEGVEVRFLVDGAGSRPTFSGKGRRMVKNSRIEFRNFLDPANIVTAWLINYSTHRKIVVIDEKIAYTGGMNVGTEYITGGKRFDSWRDTHMRFEGGSSIALLQSIFIADWVNSGGQVQDPARYLRDTYQEIEGTIPVQMLCSGPDSRWYSIHQLYFTMIANADRRVIIQSPYFVPDESIAQAMESAALTGVEVNLMITGCPDKRIPFWVAHTFFEPLLKAGVHIYLYEAGFFHAKTIVIDDVLSTTGSCNMDQRSFFLDYELNAVIYSEQAAKVLIQQFERDLEKCREMTLEDYGRIRRLSKFRNSVFRTIAPLL